MEHVFSDMRDLHRYASDQLSSYDPDDYDVDDHDELIDRLTLAIRNADGFAWNEDMSDLLDSLYDEHEGWTPVLDGEAGESYTITAEHEYGDPDYHCATLTVGDMTWSHTDGDFDLDPNTLTYRRAIAAGIIDDPDDVDEDDLDDVISDRGAFTASVREEIENAARRAADDYADAEIEAVADEAAEDIDEYAKFLWWSPRGFANECKLYGIKSDDIDEVASWLDGQDPAQSKWEWMDAEEAREELRNGTENAVNLRRGFGADNPPCGVTEITPWSDAHA